MEIIFWGENQYSRSVLKTLQKIADKVFIVDTTLEEALKLKRAEDVVIHQVDDTECKFLFFCGANENTVQKYSQEKEIFTIHESLLPKYRGEDPVFWAIMNGESVLGVSVYKVNAYLNAGDLLFQKAISYHENEPFAQIYQRMESVLEKYLDTYLSGYLNGQISLHSQNALEVSYVSKLDYEQDFFVDFNMGNMLLRRFFEAAREPYPYPRILIYNEIYEIISCQIKDMPYICMIGRVVNIDAQGVWIKTVDGYLIIDLVKRKKDQKLFRCSELVKIGYRFKKMETRIYG